MPCYHPLPAWRKRELGESGKLAITFTRTDSFDFLPMEVPCGTCIGCRLDRARQWALRCMHEAKCHEQNAFVTLTYDDSSLPSNGSLVPERFVLFMKRLRFSRYPGLRFFHCGEYGDKTDRPHHHALLFNCEFPDRVHFKGSAGSEFELWSSDELQRLWGYGHCSIGEVTAASAGYVARYTLKKSFSPGFYKDRIPPYLTMSRRPGLGSEFAKQHYKSWFYHDSVVVDGVELKPGRYYDSLCEKWAPRLLARAKRKRRQAANLSPDNTGARLIVREEVKRSAISTLIRPLED